jgi:hypothetical protein
MRRKLAALALGALFALAAASPALADQPPGQLGYEGQPGNQGGGGGPAPGLLGYEGQPGNQGGPWKLAFAPTVAGGPADVGPPALAAPIQPPGGVGARLARALAAQRRVEKLTLWEPTAGTPS